MERTKENINLFIIKNGEKSTKSHSKSEVTSVTCVFGKFIKIWLIKFDISHCIVYAYLVSVGDVNQNILR